MKFTGQIRIPDLDHPGVPATFFIEGVQAEVILEGDESLGRWSLFDVHARRLVSAAFEVDLDGEEITFIADEPIDFAYRGVERMAEAWARFKSMNVVRRKVAVSRSRKKTEPSRVPELRAAMEENLGVQAGRSPARPMVSSAPASPSPQVTPTIDKPPPRLHSRPEPQIDEPATPVVSQPGEKDSFVADTDEAGLLAAERRAIEEERRRLEEQRNLLEELKAEAAQREADRVEAFRLEMQRIEEERLEYERIETERQAALHDAMEKLEAERGEIEKKTAEQGEREREEAARAAALQAKMAELEEQRLRREEEESKRAEAARREMEELEEQRRRIESLESGQELEEEKTAEPSLAETAEDEDRREAVEAEPQPEPEPEAEPQPEPEPEAEPQPEPEPAAEPEEPVPAAAASAKGSVVDLGEFESEELDRLETGKHVQPKTPTKPKPPTAPKAAPVPETAPEQAPFPEPAIVSEPVHDEQREPEPALAATSRQSSGIMGAVRAAFGRGGREHVHDFVEAPGGIGIARSICRDCGYVSISTED